jgi:hypothetical protein
MACLAPPHVLHAFHAIARKRWGFCWVRYEQPAEQRPFISSASPVLAKFDSRPLRSAIEGLHGEVKSGGDPVAIQHWVELIQRYVLRFSHPWHVDSRIWQLWNEVDKNLAQQWTVEKLCQIAHFSSEHLRRLCQQQLGGDDARDNGREGEHDRAIGGICESIRVFEYVQEMDRMAAFGLSRAEGGKWGWSLG